MFLELDSKGLYQSAGKEKESVFSSSTKREFRNFHVVVVQQRQKNVPKKRDAPAKLFFANLNLLLFCRSRCRRPRLCSSSLIWTGLSCRSPFNMCFLSSDLQTSEVSGPGTKPLKTADVFVSYCWSNSESAHRSKQVSMAQSDILELEN